MDLAALRRQTREGLRAATVVGVIRDRDGLRAARIARCALEGGLRAVEITATTPDAFDTIKALSETHPDAVLGIGTVRTPAHLEAAARARATFAVSPHTDPNLIRMGRDLGLTMIPGGLSPTEIVTASEAGADFVKVFPVAAVGGPKYLRYLRGPLPDVHYWVSGQVALNEVADYLSAGAELIGLTGAITADLPNDFDDTVRSRAAQAVRAVFAHRESGALLTIVVDGRSTSLDLNALRELPASEHTPLDALVPGRRGQAVRLRSVLQSMAIAKEATVDVSSDDGFVRTVPARDLYDGGLVHYATDGHPLARDQGGPLRLYIAQGSDQCDNLKALTRIEVRAAG